MSDREQALQIWWAGVNAVMPRPLVREAVRKLRLPETGRILVVGAGKAGAEMAAGVEEALADCLDQVEGIVNVPEGSTAALNKIRLNPARPVGSNYPTSVGVDGSEAMLELLATAGPSDIALALISGGGSALLPAPVHGVSLESKDEISKMLANAGASIYELNCVRKHLSRIKGGQLAAAFRGSKLFSFVLSDVVGDPLDGIASGPTVPDPSTFAAAIEILRRHSSWDRIPVDAKNYLIAGENETPKRLPSNISTSILGNNAKAIQAAQREAESLGWNAVNLGSHFEGDTIRHARDVANSIRNVEARPICFLLGGETTVNLGSNPGKGGRNQEFALALLKELGEGIRGITALSAGTDGEDGPTDAAGAFADESVWIETEGQNLSIDDHLNRHDAYPFFERTGGLVKTGLTGTNVMDLRVLLIR